MKRAKRDKAREKTDKRLNDLTYEIGRVYMEHPAILEVQREYEKYMAFVEEQSKEEYTAYVTATDPEEKAKAKKAYAEKVKKLTPMGVEVTWLERFVRKTAFTFSSTKPQYLKNPSSRRFATTALMSTVLAPLASCSSFLAVI